MQGRLFFSIRYAGKTILPYLSCREDHSSVFFMQGRLFFPTLHAGKCARPRPSSEGYKRKLVMAAGYIGGRPGQGQYGTNLAMSPRPGVGWACPGRFNCGNFSAFFGHIASGV